MNLFGELMFTSDPRAAYQVRVQTMFQLFGEPLPSPILSIEISPECKPEMYGSLRVTSDPPGASIKLGDINFPSKTPAVIPKLAGSRYDLRLTMDGCEDYVESVNIVPGHETPVNAYFCRGTIILESDIGQIGCQGDGPSPFSYFGPTPYTITDRQKGNYTMALFDQLGNKPTPATVPVVVTGGATSTVYARYCGFGQFPPIEFTAGEYACRTISIPACMSGMCTWRVTPVLLTGLAFDQNRWTICGTPVTAGDYQITICCSKSDGEQSCAVIPVKVSASANRAPSANPGGPYSGPSGGTVSVHGTATDQDQDAISAWEWTFLGQTYHTQDATLVLPQLDMSRTYFLRLRVQDNRGAWSDISETTVAIQRVVAGIIVVAPNPGTASWSISPGSYTGTGYTEIEGVAPGQYRITWQPLAGYITPVSEEKALTEGKSIEFRTTYSPQSDPVEIGGDTERTVAVGAYVYWEFPTTGGTSNFAIVTTFNPVPPGLQGHSDGWLNGYPTVIGNHPFTVTAKDMGSNYSDQLECILHVVTPSGELAARPPQMNFSTEFTELITYVHNASENGAIQFSVTTDKSWITTHPSTVGVTNTDMRVKVDRNGLQPGTHTGKVLLSSSGGSLTIPVEVVVSGTSCSENPGLISPIDGNNLSLYDAVFTWERVCPSLGDYYYLVIVGQRSYTATPLTFEKLYPADTYIRYTGHALQTGRRYYWFLTDYAGTPISGIEDFQTVP